MHLTHIALWMNILVFFIPFIVVTTKCSRWVCLLLFSYHVGRVGPNLTTKFMLLVSLNLLVFVEIIFLIIHHVGLFLGGSFDISIRISLKRRSLLLYRGCCITSILRDVLSG